MELLDGFIAAPQEPVFFNQIPVEGFRLIESCSQIPLSSVLKMAGGDFQMWAYPRPGECSEEAAEKFRPLLLLPIGPDRKIVCYDFFNGEEPVFQRFANLENDEQILNFAAQFGQLRSGITIDLPGFKVFLESLNFWKGEISLLRQFLKILGEYEMKSDLAEYLVVRGDKVIFMVHGEGKIAGRNITLPLVRTESKRETVYRGMAQFLDEKMADAPLTVSHRSRGGAFESILMPLNLQGAIWLQLSQAFFGDGPTENRVRRDVLTGKYYRERNSAGEKLMWRRKKEPYMGHYYHWNNMRRFNEQKRKRIAAAVRGEAVKDDRKGRTDFLVEFDEIGEPVAVIAERRKKEKANKR